MIGETNLATLLATMQPDLLEGEFVFCTLDAAAQSTLNLTELGPIGWFREAEGLTLILSRSAADAAQLSYQATFRMITLTVHSSLEAVGFLAAITSKLAAHGISVNPVSAYYHDHLFVPTAKAAQTMDLLHQMTE